MKTVKVRIPVVVDTKGNWNAVGWHIGKAQKDGDLLDAAYTGMDDCPEPWQVAWITAEVPVPEVHPVLEIEGTVEVEDKP